MTASSPFKASTPALKSPRASPFRRPQSPASPSPLRNPAIIASPIDDTISKPQSPLRNSTNLTSPPAVDEAPVKPIGTPPKLAPEESPIRPSDTPPKLDLPKLDFDMSPPSWSPHGLKSTEHTPTKPGNVSSRASMFSNVDKLESPRRSTPSVASTTASPPKRPSYGARAMSESNALSKLQPAQVRELRECFQILDRDSDGVVDKDDVVDMLNQLGLPSSANDLAAFFPPDRPQTSTMAVFLTQISTLLASISPSGELLNAFSAFDDDDSGQVDLAELRDALLHTIPDQGEQALTASEVDRVLGGFSGRRAFGKTMIGGKRGEVFKYQEFVNSISGGKEKATAEVPE